MVFSKRKRAVKNVTIEKKTVAGNRMIVTLRLLPPFAEYPHKYTILQSKKNAIEKRHLLFSLIPDVLWFIIFF